MHKFTTSIALLITLFFTITTLATNYNPINTGDQTQQKIEQMMERAGVKTTQVIKVSESTDENSSNQPAIVEPQPFEIPQPPYTRSQKTTDSYNQSSATTTPTSQPQTKRKPILNIFTPTTTGDTDQTKEDQKPFLIPQPTGIQYR